MNPNKQYLNTLHTPIGPMRRFGMMINGEDYTPPAELLTCNPLVLPETPSVDILDYIQRERRCTKRKVTGVVNE